MLRYSFSGYLVELAKKQAKDTTYFVLGNSSVDYDSFFGSILLAYWLSNITERFYIPIISCLKQQIRLRFEITYILQKLQISKDTFHYAQNLTQQRMNNDIFNLVDHNNRLGIKNIEYITDHHQIKQIIARKYLIHSLGSNLTNIYYLLNPNKLLLIDNQPEYVQKFNNFIEKEPFAISKQQQNKDLIIQQIIRYGILVDSFNFNPKQSSRWSNLDKKAVQFIQQNKNYQIGYKQLDQIKFDTKMYKSLNLRQTLIKDFKRQTYNKQIQPIVIDYSIIYIKPSQYTDYYQEQMKKQFTLNKQEANIYILMSIFKGNDNNYQRQMLFRFKNVSQNTKNNFIQIVKNMGNIYIDNIDQWIWFRNPSGKLSRKLFDAKLTQNIAKL